MSEQATSGRGRRALKTAGIVLASLAALLLVALVALYFLAEPLVERYIKKQVARQSEGLYQVEIGELDLSLSTWGITLQGLHFYPDTAVHRRQKERGQAVRILFEVQSPKLTVTGIHLIDLLFNDRFRVATLVAERPVITQLLDETVEKAGQRDSKSGSALKAVRIRKLYLREASYRFQLLGQPGRPQHEIPRLALQVQDLRLDLEAQQDITRRFQADSIKLDIRHYSYHSPDSVYTIRVGRFSYTSGQQELKAVDVFVQPNLRANAALPKDQAHRLLYQLSTPFLSVQGLDVAAAWQNKQLQLDQVLLERADLHIHEDLSVPDTTSFPKLSELYASVSPYLREIGVGELRLGDGSFLYSEKTGVVDTVHYLVKANIDLTSVQLDSATLFTPKEKAFAEAIQFSAGSYTYRPRNSPYTLKTGSLQLSTHDKTLQADTLHLAGDWGKNDNLKSLNKAKRTLYDIRLPRLRFQDLDLPEALRTSRMAIGSIAAEQPVIDVRTDRLVKVPDAGPDLQKLYRQLSGWINTLEVGEIRLTDAALTQHSKTKSIQRLQQMEHASLTANGLVVDSAFIFNPEIKLPLQDLVLTARNYRYRMPDNTYTFALSGLRYSTRQQEFSARSVDVISSMRENDRQKLFNNASRNLLDLSAGTLQITGLDMIRALNTGRLEADMLLLRQPDVAILLDRQVAASSQGQQEAGKELFDLLDVIAVQDIRLEDGSFTFSEKLEPVMRTHLLEHATATVSGFELTPDSFAKLDEALPMEEMTLQATDYTYRSNDSLYIFHLDSLYYSSMNQDIIAQAFTVNADRQVNERLKATDPERASRNLVDISSGRSIITGFNLLHAYATGQYHMNLLLLASPRVKILQDHNVPSAIDKATAGQDTTATSGAMEALSDMVTTFQVDRLEVANGIFEFQIQEDTIRESQTLAHVALAIDQLRLVSLEANDPLDIFDADDVSLLVRGYTFFTRDSLYALEAKEIRASMRERTLSADSVRLRPLYSKEEYATLFTYARDRIDLEVPGVEMQGISLRRLFNNQDLIAHKLLIRNPKLELYRDNRLGLDPALRPPTMQGLLREAGFYIRLDTVLVEKNKLLNAVIATTGLKPGVFMLENLRLELFNVTNDSVFIRQNNIVTVNATADLMGTSTAQARFLFEMDHPEDRYTYEGTLEPMDFTALNPLLENLMFIRIKSGRINKATFSVEATRDEATGQVQLPYNNLKIELLNKHDPEHPGFMLKVGSLLVNLLIIKSNNPSTWGKFREGVVHEKRDPKRSVYYHMSQSMLDGITTSLMTKLVQRIVTRFVDL